MRRVIVHAIPLLVLAGLVLAVFALVVLGFGRPPTGAESGWLAASMVAAGVCALVYAAARGRLVTLADRLAYGERRHPAQQLRSVTSGLTRAVSTDQLLLELAESLRRRLALDAVELWTRPGGLLERRASDPEREQATLRLGEPETRLLSRGTVSGPTWLRVWLPQFLAGRGSTTSASCRSRVGGALRPDRRRAGEGAASRSAT